MVPNRAIQIVYFHALFPLGRIRGPPLFLYNQHQAMNPATAKTYLNQAEVAGPILALFASSRP